MSNPKNWYSITNKSEQSAEVFIYDEIGMWGISAKAFLDELKSVGNRHIELHINSPGGEVFDGLAIYNRLAAHPAGVDVCIDGIAASMASVIAMVGRTVSMADNAFLFVHNPMGICMGNAEDMRGLADDLDKIGSALVGTYTKRTKMSADDVVKLMDAETLMDAKQAKELGFIDHITEPMKMAANFNQLRPDARLEAREKNLEKVVDLNLQGIKTVAMPANVTEDPPKETPPQDPPSPPAPPEGETAAMKSIKAKAFADGVTAENKRVGDITAWAKEVSDLRKIDLSAFVAEFTGDKTKTFADFKEHVLKNEFKSQAVATTTDTAGAQGNTMTRDAFAKLSPFNQSDFCRKGGKITD
jgi:ATP-dependent Clp endopeptidase proteolytic subunit ClpP